MTASKRTTDEVAELQAQVAALTALVASIAKPVAVKTVKKAVKKATKPERVKPSAKDIKAYEALWVERVALRRQLGLKGWKADESSKNPRMKKIVAEMNALGGVKAMIGFAKYPA